MAMAMATHGKRRRTVARPRLETAWLAMLLLLGSAAAQQQQHQHQQQRKHGDDSDRRNNGNTNTHPVTILAKLDATILESTPYGSYGHLPDLQFIASTTNHKIESIVKFDLSNFLLNNGHEGAIASAHLRLYASEDCTFYNHPLKENLGLFEVGLASEGGNGNGGDNEDYMSWSTAPQLPPHGATLVEPLGTLQPNHWFELEVTSLVLSSIGIIQSTEMTLRLDSMLFVNTDLESLSACTFASKEWQGGSYSPQLVIEVQDINSNSIGQRQITSTHNNNNNNQNNDMSASRNRKTMQECAPSYRKHRDYDAGEIISNGGTNYVCKPFPYTSWCGNESYAPGSSGGHWDMAWELLDNCDSSTPQQQFSNQRDVPNSKNNNEYYTNNDLNYQTPYQTMASNVANTPSCASPYDKSFKGYIGGEVVSNLGNNYECLELPAASWCAFEQYAPGVSSYWNLAWKLLDECQEKTQKQATHSNNNIQPYKPNENNNNNGSKKNSNQAIGGCPPTWQMQYAYRVHERVTCSQTLAIYECKEYPYTPSCGDPAAQVPSGPIFGDVWRVVGKCMDGQAFVEGDGNLAMDGNIPLASIGNVARPTKQPTRRPRRRRTTQPTGRPTSRPAQRPSPRPVAQIQTVQLNKKIDDCGPKFRRGESYSGDDVVSFRGNNYKCSLPRWCSMPEFEPEKGKYWTLVWDPVGTCSGTRTEEGSISGDGFGDVAPIGSVSVTNPKQSGAQKPASKPRPNSKQGTSPKIIADTAEPPCPEFWALGYGYVEGDTVSANGQIYICKGYPTTAWCGMDAVYEPVVGAHWDMAWGIEGDCTGGSTRIPTSKPTSNPTKNPIPKRTPNPTQRAVVGDTKPSPDESASFVKPARPTNPRPSSPSKYGMVNDNDEAKKDHRVFDILETKKSLIDDTLFLYQGLDPSTVYRYEGFIAGLKIMFEDGVAGKYFYLGDDDKSVDGKSGHLYGLVNIAAFIGQSMKETIQYDACDENSWDYFDMVYPLSNACGQLGQSYQDYHCSPEQAHMECEVDPDMSIKAVTHAKWYGAPGPLFCGPKSEYPEVGIWDYTYECNNPWAEPPEYCTVYGDQKAGRYDNSKPVANRNGRTDVEGCCWWGRGVIQTTGICNFGKLNYFLGKRAAEEGRDSRYPKIDFCKDPGIICSSEEHKELKWIAGMFYWIESLQSYDERGWNYMDGLHDFVDGGMQDNSFINKVSGIVNRGCHDPPCGTGAVDGMHERAENFAKVISTIKP